ncbi:MAG: hypothetical protein LBU99_03760 [Spirochaetaceae bacterium]|jgi:hypothetical protein|nr:hypothetical protein [Spirochaetaceae bacterium]
MIGREPQNENDLFFVCSVIEYIGRKTKNKRSAVVLKLGATEITRLLDLADVFHCEPIEKTAGDLIATYDITEGCFDNVSMGKFRIPTHFDMGKVYKRLIAAISESQRISFTEALIAVYTSWISDKIDDYNSSMYFESPQYLYESYVAGEPL